MTQTFVDISSGEFFPVLEAMDQGVLIADKNGYILYYNKSHAEMDGLLYEDVKNAKITDVYEVDESESLVMRCIKNKKAIINATHFYTAKNGRFVNSINSVFPLKKNGLLIGAINFVKNYEYLDDIINTIDGAHKKSPIINETRFTFSSIVGKSPSLLDALNKAKLASNSPSPIMIYGETGTGKELLAQAVHNYSYRKKAPYMAVNCAAIPESLLEGILFGSTKGAFTGAMEKPGLFEQANGGTLFLDEINSMSLSLQSKLLRVLQEKKVRRVGAEKETVLDLKLLSSTNIVPQEAISKGDLRKDLFYRLAVVFLRIPPLREHLDDIDLLIDFFIDKHNAIMGKRVDRVSTDLKSVFRTYRWPGNVRELENLIEGAMNMVGSGKLIEKHHLTSDVGFPESPEKAPTEQQNIPDEKEKIVTVLSGCRGNIRKTAEKLNMSRQTLHKKIKKYSIDKNTIMSDIEKYQIENALYNSKGNIKSAADTLSMSRQLLNYKIKKYNIEKPDFKT